MARGGIEMDVTIGKKPKSNAPSNDTPFRILVLGSFSGNTRAAFAKPIRVEPTELDELMQRLLPRVSLGYPDGTQLDVTFEELDDFHPDALYDRLPVFGAMRDLRSRLQNPSTYGTTMQELRGSESVAAASGESTGDTLERLLGKTPSAPTRTGLDGLIRQIVAPHIVRAPHPDQAAHVAAADAALGKLMQTVLHHPDFQALESAWRGLDFLLRNVEGADVFAADWSRAELEESLEGDGLLELLAGGAANEPRYALVVGLYSFDDSPADAEVATRLCAVLARAHVPWVSAADSKYAMHDDPPGWVSWTAVRGYDGSSLLGLALPRFLLRLPYGKGAEEAERFAFEEQPSPPEPARYLWGNSALLVASLLARAFDRAGWAMTSSDVLSVQGLPVHAWRVEGEPEQTPCAETWIRESTAEKLLGQGFIPVCSVRGRGSVKLLRVQSVRPTASLAGCWA